MVPTYYGSMPLIPYLTRKLHAVCKLAVVWYGSADTSSEFVGGYRVKVQHCRTKRARELHFHVSMHRAEPEKHFVYHSASTKAMMKFLFALIILTLSTFCSVTAQFNPANCVNFAALEFDLFAFDRYPVFFNENSTMVLAQAGEYFGPEDIEEYVRFASADSPYFASEESFNATNFPPSVDFATEECIFTLAGANFYELEPSTTIGGSVAVVFGAKIFYSPVENVITRVNIFYDTPWLEWFFGVALDTPATRSFVCDVLTSDSCSEVRMLNDNISVQGCNDRLSMLEFAEGEDAYVVGNTQGCRFLHSVFARTNPNHCPHISFAPVEDSKGAFKCQSTPFINVTDLFTEDEIAAIEQFCLDVPEIGTSDCFKVIAEANITTEAPTDSPTAGSDAFVRVSSWTVLFVALVSFLYDL
uniref:Uncharacterized protein n=1 Tax=Amphora coffeiformis TaxID=265554 RepID=A0A7S3L903_9STRA|eukprot:scaffold5454_cov176-Amphora_coffeaeformis.AAC.2